MDRIAFLTDFIEKNPTDLFSRHALAMEMIKLGNDQEAKLVLDQILLIDNNYVGSYYHLGKIEERLGMMNEALVTYEKGIQVATALGDQQALRELKAALNQLRDELED
jgi:tetratricopeptide (TPR) repeat protein